jgi:predicted aspartyl protease
MRIRERVNVQGGFGEAMTDGLVDTGAELSMIPASLAGRIGAWTTAYQRTVLGVHQDARTLPIMVVTLTFPRLKVAGQFLFAMADVGEELILGMDVLAPLGISVDTGTQDLSVRNEVWEAFKTLAALGVLVVGGVKLLGKA